jgi:hypothetical protein
MRRIRVSRPTPIYTPNLLSSDLQIPGLEAAETAGTVSGTHLGTHPAVKPGIFDTNGAVSANAEEAHTGFEPVLPP